jgi:hypothetical protein
LRAAYILLIGILKLLGCPPRCNNVVCTLDSTQDILIACALIALYTGILYGVLPKSGSSKAGIEALELTWEIDLMGWLGGTLFAAALAIHLRKSAAFKKSPVRAVARWSAVCLLVCRAWSRPHPSRGASCPRQRWPDLGRPSRACGFVAPRRGTGTRRPKPASASRLRPPRARLRRCHPRPLRLARRAAPSSRTIHSSRTCLSNRRLAMPALSKTTRRCNRRHRCLPPRQTRPRMYDIDIEQVAG